MIFFRGGITKIGAVGFHSRLRIIDPHGLIDQHIGTRSTRLGEGYSGHEKYDVEYTLGRVPDLIMLFNRPSEMPLRAADQSGSLWGDFNNQVFQHPQLRQDYQFESHDMGMGYINFYAHKSLREAEAAGGEQSRAGAADG